MSEIKSSFELVDISNRAANQIEAGKLWIYSNEVPGNRPEAGTWVWFAHQGHIIATGYINPHSLILGRVVCLGKEDDISALLSYRLTTALARRVPLLDIGSVRLVFSEADFLPGLIVDWYSGVVVIQSSTAGMDTVLPLIQSLLQTILEQMKIPCQGMVIRADHSVRQLEGIASFNRVVFGDPGALSLATFSENQVFYSADFIQGQKTGFFLDQRDNRAHFEQSVKSGSSVTALDLFCYSGGWGLRALKAGAARVTFVDQSSEALDHVKRGIALNQLDAEKTRLVEMDVFDFLSADNSLYDVVVADPPAFVKSKKVLNQAKKAYEKLVRLSWNRLKPGGILYFCSCSYHLSRSEFLELAANAVAKEKGQAHLVYQGAQPIDHPILLSMPETAYLKCAGLKKLSSI